MPESKTAVFLNYADGVPLANLTRDQAERLLDFVENELVQSDATRELADGLRRVLREYERRGVTMTDDTIERLRAKAWTESGSNPIVELHHAEAAVREAGAECGDLAQLLGEAIEREKALEAEVAQLRKAGNALADLIHRSPYGESHRAAYRAWQALRGEGDGHAT